MSAVLVVALSTVAALLVGLFAVQPAAATVRRTLAQYAERRHARKAWVELTASVMSLGAGNAPLQIVEFTDYQCPFCRRAEVRLDSAVNRGMIKLHVRHIPWTSAHPAAEGAARTAICANQQGRFAAVHRLLMTTEEWQKDTNWVVIARVGGVADAEKFSACLRSPETMAALARDRQLADQLPVTGTPTFITENGVYHGLTIEAIAEIDRYAAPPR
jgi:protein-disulfide isomerase